MATLTPQERAEVAALLMQDAKVGVLNGLLKSDIKATIDALDVYLSANWTSINQSIPQPSRGALTAKQKALALSLVVQKRFNVEL